MVVQNVVFLAQDNCRTLCRDTLDVERVSIGEVVLDLIQYLKDFACKSDAFIGVTDVTKLIRLGVPFYFAWVGLSVVAIVFDDYLRYWFFGEEKPHYKIV